MDDRGTFEVFAFLSSKEERLLEAELLGARGLSVVRGRPMTTRRRLWQGMCFRAIEFVYPSSNERA